MPNTLRLHGTAPESIVDGPGLRYAIFTQGCPHACPGCHNPESHDPTAGEECDIDRLFAEIQENPLLSGVTFSGGEAFLQAQALCMLARKLKKQQIHIVTYTGYTLENLRNMAQKDAYVAELLTLTDMLIDGPYVQHLRNAELCFCGSENQRVWLKDAEGWKVATS